MPVHRLSLGMQTDQFAIAGNLFIGDIAHACLSAEQDAGDRGGIQPVGLGSQPPARSLLMGLSRMQQTQVIASLLEKVKEILPIA